MTASQPIKWPPSRQTIGARRRTTMSSDSTTVAAIENASGTYSPGCRNWFCECARKMSTASPAKLNRANSSIQSGGSLRQSAPAAAMLTAELVGHGAQLHGPRQHGIVAVPLDEVGA